MDQALSWLDASGLPGNAVVLDCGCGPGILTRQVAGRGYRVLGMDPSRAMLERASGTRDSGQRPVVGYLQGDVERLPFPDACLDAVVCLGVVTHLRSAHRSLGEIARVLKPGGTLVLSIVNKAHLPHYLDLPRFVAGRLRKAIGGRIRHARPAGGAKGSPLVRSYLVPEMSKSLRVHGFIVLDCASVPLGLLTFFGRDIPPRGVNQRVAELLARSWRVPVVGSLGGMCIFKARMGPLPGGCDAALYERGRAAECG